MLKATVWALIVVFLCNSSNAHVGICILRVMTKIWYISFRFFLHKYCCADADDSTVAAAADDDDDDCIKLKWLYLYTPTNEIRGYTGVSRQSGSWVLMVCWWNVWFQTPSTVFKSSKWYFFMWQNFNPG